MSKSEYQKGSARRETRAALRQARMKREAEEHEAARARLRQKTEVTVAMLAELRVQHLGAGHFVNGNYITGVGVRDAALAMKPDTIAPSDKGGRK